MRILSIFVACFLFASFLVNLTRAVVEVVASKSLTVQPTGPRSGDAGSKYLNIEGKDNEKYASFGVLVFDIPKEVQDKKVKSVSLTTRPEHPEVCQGWCDPLLPGTGT